MLNSHDYNALVGLLTQFLMDDYAGDPDTRRASYRRLTVSLYRHTNGVLRRAARVLALASDVRWAWQSFTDDVWAAEAEGRAAEERRRAEARWMPGYLRYQEDDLPVTALGLYPEGFRVIHMTRDGWYCDGKAVEDPRMWMPIPPHPAAPPWEMRPAAQPEGQAGSESSEPASSAARPAE